MTLISLKNIIAPSFYDVHKHIKNYDFTHYWLKGGRMSTKSSFTAIEIILGIMKDPKANAVVLRKVGDTLSDSVYSQLIWAIEILGVSDYWSMKVSPLKLVYTPTEQTILFRSANNKEDHKKIKSLKIKKGYCKFIWYEEVDEFYGMEEIRSINQTLMRGGDKFIVFYSFNPPKSVNNWVNAEIIIPKDNTLVHHSTYLDVPRHWLGEPAIIEAETLKKTNELLYRNEYLGEATGTGGAVFTNLNIRTITSEELKSFDNILDGNDFGYAVDPNAYVQVHLDKKHRKLYIFNEIYKVGLSNSQLADMIKKIKIGNSYITCDSSEPKSIAELKSLGLKVQGAKKGPDSIDYGVKYLQHLTEIIIDPIRCPNTAQEFKLYEYEKDRLGNFKAKYPDMNNHSIDSVRYAIESESLKNKWNFSKRSII